jgi:hypothetical protein
MLQINDQNRLYTYIVAHDGGNAPNPFHGTCTLAICKPKIRSTAKVGDIIVGLDHGKYSNRIVYCMKVSHIFSWADYIKECNTKGSVLNKKIPKGKLDQGDCIWKTSGPTYENSLPSWSKHKGEVCFNTDVLSGKNVLASSEYWYFGKENEQYKIILRGDLQKIIPGRGHKSYFNDPYKNNFIKYFNDELKRMGIDSPAVNTRIFGEPAFGPENSDIEKCIACRKMELEREHCDEEVC